jgi:putative transposase
LEREGIAINSIFAVCRDLQVRVHAASGANDHIHIAVSVPPKYAVSEVARKIKGTSSTILRNHGDWPGWQNEYGVLTFSTSAIGAVVAYIQNQKSHHANGLLNARMERIDRRDD